MLGVATQFMINQLEQILDRCCKDSDPFLTTEEFDYVLDLKDQHRETNDLSFNQVYDGIALVYKTELKFAEAEVAHLKERVEVHAAQAGTKEFHDEQL